MLKWLIMYRSLTISKGFDHSKSLTRKYCQTLQNSGQRTFLTPPERFTKSAPRTLDLVVQTTQTHPVATESEVIFGLCVDLQFYSKFGSKELTKSGGGTVIICYPRGSSRNLPYLPEEWYNTGKLV